MKKIIIALSLFATTTFAKTPCNIGDYLYQDFSCSQELNNQKQPIGIVFDAANKTAVALKQQNKQWSNTPVNMEIYPPKGMMKTKKDALNEFGGQELQEIIEIRAPEFYPAIMYCASINTVQGNSWYLPQMGVLNKIYQAQETINNSLSNINNADLISSNYAYWSSSQYSYSQTWRQYFLNGFIDYQGNNSQNITRCVINY